MKIGVLSDTHGSLKYFDQALESLGSCHYIIHGGDVLYHGPRNPLPEGYNPKELAQRINSLNNIIFTRGNCDADVDQMVIDHPIQSPYVFTQLGRLKIFLCHGYEKEKSVLVKMAKGFGAHLFIYGHTHIKELYRDEDLIVLNPGSISLPKDGIHSAAVIDERAVRLIDISNNEVIKELAL
ncbi:putative phosphoesterase [Desulfohalotomaculum tongense]|uniref:phosphodiesterase n=1 Tax=Desulforadius tongensis TaxID=1216062 RepID=UPI00195A076E|nr:phosphodiesterase [Desulforadius tongensis]MBM7854796.1 putative phosphoesterase [Desulforadius tongensis]